METTYPADQLETRIVSSLTKVFADEELQALPQHSGSALRGETYSFQMAYRTNIHMRSLQVHVESELLPHIELRTVELAPAEFVNYHDADEFVLRMTPGLYPIRSFR
ncbi:hypothetical protein NYE70_21680 [Paenibacillus sp. FSL R5-0407]|uniref:hypothetical protein n=1 Tax=Paenibacillus sp. FSL R5-0407 TaxID=2975320 RepID=UPI0030F6C55D